MNLVGVTYSFAYVLHPALLRLFIRVFVRLPRQGTGDKRLFRSRLLQSCQETNHYESSALIADVMFALMRLCTLYTAGDGVGPVGQERVLHGQRGHREILPPQAAGEGPPIPCRCAGLCVRDRIHRHRGVCHRRRDRPQVSPPIGSLPITVRLAARVPFTLASNLYDLLLLLAFRFDCRYLQLYCLSVLWSYVSC